MGWTSGALGKWMESVVESGNIVDKEKVRTSGQWGAALVVWGRSTPRPRECGGLVPGYTRDGGRKVGWNWRVEAWAGLGWRGLAWAGMGWRGWCGLTWVGRGWRAVVWGGRLGTV